MKLRSSWMDHSSLKSPVDNKLECVNLRVNDFHFFFSHLSQVPGKSLVIASEGFQESSFISIFLFEWHDASVEWFSLLKIISNSISSLEKLLDQIKNEWRSWRFLHHWFKSIEVGIEVLLSVEDSKGELLCNAGDVHESWCRKWLESDWFYHDCFWNSSF